MFFFDIDGGATPPLRLPIARHAPPHQCIDPIQASQYRHLGQTREKLRLRVEIASTQDSRARMSRMASPLFGGK